MRIVAGSAGGRRIAVPAGTGTRPTSDRAREGLFSSLQHWLDLPGARVLDLYAGSGAFGLEALSRGAAQATLVESDPVAAAAITANVASLRLGAATVYTEPVRRFLQRPAEGPPYDLVFADPPYELPADELRALLDVLAPDRLTVGAIVVVERSSRDPQWEWPQSLVALRARRYGAGTLWYGRRP